MLDLEETFKRIVGEELFPKLQPEQNRSQLVACSIAGKIYVAEDMEGSIIGVALWFGPGREIYDR